MPLNCKYQRAGVCCCDRRVQAALQIERSYQQRTSNVFLFWGRDPVMRAGAGLSISLALTSLPGSWQHVTEGVREVCGRCPCRWLVPAAVGPQAPWLMQSGWKWSSGYPRCWGCLAFGQRDPELMP